MTENEPSRDEREVVCAELRSVQSKCFRLKEEVRRLRAATASPEAARLRAEAQKYKAALSAIVFHYEQGDLTAASARGIAFRALNTDLSWKRSKKKREIRRMMIAAERAASPHPDGQ